MKSRLVAQRGFTLVEVTIILLTLVILSAIMLPQMGNFNRLARFVRVKEDLGALCSVLKTMLDDVGAGAFYTEVMEDGRPNPWDPAGLLIGYGEPPMIGSAEAGENWTLELGTEFQVPTDGGGIEPDFYVDTMDNHLIANKMLGDSNHRWRSPLEMRRGFASLFAWRGPYVSDEVMPDPWGFRYMANVFALHNPPSGGPYDRFGSAVVCYSAGPDGHIDTDFNQPTGWTTGDDDLTVLLSAGGPM